MERVARNGLLYSRMFSTALCSPTRAALITGRDKATIGRLLKDNGNSTAWFGKDHNLPSFQASQSGPFDQWPTGMGFEYF